MNYMVMPGLKQTRGKVRPMVVTKYESDIVIKVVCDYFGVTQEEIKKKCRKREIVYKRQIAMYFLVQYTSKTYVEIGRFFDKDHTTVLYAKDLIRDLISIDEKVKGDVDAIKAKLVEAYF
jgi:chromosomal replication initiator protein